MQQDLSAFVRRLTLLRNELLQEKERNKRTQHRIKTLKQSHDQKSLQWKDLLSKEEAVKTQYVETQRATDQEKSRMKKVKEKISGTFASFKGAEMFNRIRGFISTVKKNGRSVLHELTNVLKGEAYIPVLGC